MDPLRGRKAYDAEPLRRAELDPDPVRQCLRWIDEAGEAGVVEPNAVVLATADGSGRPRVRNLLVRRLDDDGLVVFSHTDGPKGRAIAENPVASGLFSWLSVLRQVRVDGRVEVVDDDVADDYWASRPRGSRIASAASPQSRVVASRRELEERWAETERRWAGRDVPRPARWGGYRLIPDEWEFWSGRPNRFHDRFRYRRDDAGGWLIERLGP